MRRLIDADALMDYLTMMPIDLGYSEVEEIEQFVNDAPTIDAIPISFIEEQVNLCNEIGFRRGEECYMALIEKWREKNGTEVN